MIRILGTPTEEMKNAAAHCAAILRLEGDCLIELEFVDASAIKELNARTRNTDKETDVLSFPMLSEIKPFTKENYPYDYMEDEGAVMLGSVVICKEVASVQAASFGHSETREYTYLFVHGMLHLLGFDHMEEDDKRKMREKEEEILKATGVER